MDEHADQKKEAWEGSRAFSGQTGIMGLLENLTLQVGFYS